MTEIAFQFIPSRAGGLDICIDDRYIDDICHKEGGVTSIKLNQKRKLEFSELGSVKYTVETESSEDIDFNQEFESAKDSVQDTLNIDVSTNTVCLIISGENPIQSYLEQKSRIQAFGEDEFNYGDPDYSELNSNTIKLSFRQRAIV